MSKQIKVGVAVREVKNGKLVGPVGEVSGVTPGDWVVKFFDREVKIKVSAVIAVDAAPVTRQDVIDQATNLLYIGKLSMFNFIKYRQIKQLFFTELPRTNWGIFYEVDEHGQVTVHEKVVFTGRDKVEIYRKK